MKFERLTPAIGARVTGIDLRQITRDHRDELRGHLEQHLVLFFAEQDLDVPAYKRFGEALGELEIPPTLPTLDDAFKVVHYLDITPGTFQRGAFADRWHSDVPFQECPPYGSILRPEILPPLGGDTLWASMYAAYEALPDSLRRLADDLMAVNAVDLTGKPRHEATHPVVRVNPATGRRGLYVNSIFTKNIVGLTPADSAKLLDLFYTHIGSPDFQVRFRWTSDIVAVWDNRFTQHYAVNDYAERRRMLRMTMSGDRPIGPREYGQARATAA